jgi:hypothetical protein
MKILLLFLCIATIGFAQNGVEIRLVNESYCGTIPNGTIYNTTESSDALLNAIIQPYGVTLYFPKGGHPYFPYSSRIMQINTSTTANINQLVSDLQAYSSVVEYAAVADQFSFSDALVLELNDVNVGIPTGITSNIITTNDAGLNQIFQNNNVYYDCQKYPATSGNLLKYYTVVCNCNVSVLKSQLESYTSVINSTEVAGAVYLASNQFQKSKTSISPNPFTNNFNIQTEEIISNYTLIDISGKKLITTNSKNELDKLSTSLNSGIYFLNMLLENGENVNFKVVKE